MGTTSTYEVLFRKALFIRMFEEKIIELYPSDKIQSPVHLSIGQEAVAVGACDTLRATDLLFGTYRGHAFYLAKGGCPKAMMAELYGKATGCGHGKAGSMHLAAPEVGFMGSSAVVASTIPHGVGAAYAAKLRGLDQVIVTVFGDGATDEGVYHESLNFAALKKVPLVFLCENNGLAVHSHQKDRQTFKLLEHARQYGLDVERIDAGYDFLEVAKRMSDIYARVRSGAGPCLVEVVTARYHEHVGTGLDFQAGYRSSSECDQWKTKDPLCFDEGLIKTNIRSIRQELDEAVRFAEDSPWPSETDLLSDVY